MCSLQEYDIKQPVEIRNDRENDSILKPLYALEQRRKHTCQEKRLADQSTHWESIWIAMH